MANALSRNSDWRPDRRCASRRCELSRVRRRRRLTRAQRRGIFSSRSRSTKTPTCWCSINPWGLRSRAAPGLPAILTRCSRRCGMRAANVRAWCTVSTKTPLDVCSWPRRALRRRRWQKPSAHARREKSTGPWSRACRSRARGASRPSLPRRREGMIRSCAWHATARRAPATPSRIMP